MKKILYKTCIRPIITYGHQIWTAAAEKHINKIQIIQNKFLRIILNKPYFTPIKLLHESAKIPTIKKFIFDSLKKAYNPEHQNNFIRNTGNYDITAIPLKIRTKLPKHSTSLG